MKAGNEAEHLLWDRFFNLRLSGNKWFHESNLEVSVAVCYVWIPIFLPVKSEKLCLQCRRFPIVLHERLVKVTEVRNEANARVVYLSEAPWPWGALGFVTMATHVYRDTCASVGILPCVLCLLTKKSSCARVKCERALACLPGVFAGIVRQPVCQLSSDKHCQWDRSTLLCRVKERSAAAWSASFTHTKKRNFGATHLQAAPAAPNLSSFLMPPQIQLFSFSCHGLLGL